MCRWEGIRWLLLKVEGFMGIFPHGGWGWRRWMGGVRLRVLGFVLRWGRVGDKGEGGGEGEGEEGGKGGKGGKGGREEGRKGGREEGRKGGREEGRKGGREERKKEKAVRDCDERERKG